MTFASVKPSVRRKPSLNIDRWVNELFNTHTPVRSKTLNRTHGLAHPPVNVVELGDGFTIQFAVPGMAKDHFEIKVEKDLLTVSGKREVNTQEGESFRRKEFGTLTFNRHFQLPETVDTQAIGADYTNGILTITVPKKAEAQDQPPRKILVA